MQHTGSAKVPLIPAALLNWAEVDVELWMEPQEWSFKLACKLLKHAKTAPVATLEVPLWPLSAKPNCKVSLQFG